MILAVLGGSRAEIDDMWWNEFVAEYETASRLKRLGW